MKIGTIINYVRIQLDVNGKIEIRTDTHKAIGVNEDRCVIDTGHFQTIDLKKIQLNMNPVLNKVKNDEITFGIDCVDDFVQSYIYTTESIELAIHTCRDILEKFIYSDEKVASYKPFFSKLRDLGFDSTPAQKEGLK